MTGVDTEILRRAVGALVQDCPDSARVVVADQLARSTLLADNLRVKSKVHPKYKTKYHGGNWPEYEQALVRRGDVPHACLYGNTLLPIGGNWLDFCYLIPVLIGAAGEI